MRARLVVFALLAVGCDGSATAPAQPYGLSLAASLSAAPSDRANLSITHAQLHLASVAAISDRAASDARAQATDVDLPVGGMASQSWPSAPPGLYSGVTLVLGDEANAGVDIMAVWRAAAVHVTIASGALDVFCASPAQLQLGQPVQLDLTADPSTWLDGVDLTTIKNDADDSTLIISNDDNANLGDRVLANVTSSFHLGCALH